MIECIKERLANDIAEAKFMAWIPLELENINYTKFREPIFVILLFPH